MRKINIMLGIAVLFICLGVNKDILAQQCCSSNNMDEILTNLQIQVLNSSGQPISSLSPGTTYTLRIQATQGICSVTGSGCNSSNSPTSFLISYAAGCLINGGTVPPTKGDDVGSANNYTANFQLTTLSGGSFSDRIVLLIDMQCTLVGVCGLQTSTIPKSFEFPEN